MEPGQGLGLTRSPTVGVPGDTGLREAFQAKGRSWCAKAPAGWECWGGCEESRDWGSPRRALGVHGGLGVCACGRGGGVEGPVAVGSPCMGSLAWACWPGRGQWQVKGLKEIQEVGLRA